MGIQLRALAEYEPPCEPFDELFEGVTERWHTPAPGGRQVWVGTAELDLRAEAYPLWNEPGPTRVVLLRLVGMVIEAVNGRRPLAQLRATMDAQVYEAMSTRVRELGNQGRPRLRSMHTCRPTADAIEVCATVLRGGRVMVFVGRVERDGTAWRWTALRALLPGRAR